MEIIRNFYKKSILTLTLAGGLAISSLTYGQDNPTPSTLPIYENPCEFLTRYGEEAFQELQKIQQKYATIIEATNQAKSEMIITAPQRYRFLERIQDMDPSMLEAGVKGFQQVSQNAITIDSLISDIESLFDQPPSTEEDDQLIKTDKEGIYQEDTNYNALAEETKEYRMAVKRVIIKHLMDPKFQNEINQHLDEYGNVILGRILGEEFIAEMDSINARIDYLKLQQSGEIQDLITSLESQKN